jgi:Arc/MetJ-type ribon-helix-helix transcriptional regulator
VVEANSTTLKAENGEKMQEKETLDERLPGLFEPDTLLPIQYFEAMRKKHLLEGEKRLILSVLEDAIECFMKCIDASTSKGQRLFRDADEWIAHEDKRWVFSFDNVCDMLDINPEYMRMGLRKWKEKRLDAIARRRAQLVLESERAAAEAAMQPADAVAAIAQPAAAIAAAIQKPATKVAGKAAARVKRRPERVRVAKRASARKLRKARA